MLRPGLQERLESSDFGRGLINAFIVITLLAIVAVNLPNSAIRRDALRPGQPYLDALGLDQSWALFAPDPRRSVIDLQAMITFDDGSTAIWRFPHDGPLIGGYRDYRWRKWAENTINDRNANLLWRPAALWAAARVNRGGRREMSVTLIRRYYNLNPPGATPSHGPWTSQGFFILRLNRARRA
jgi:hypothetical protein